MKVSLTSIFLFVVIVFAVGTGIVLAKGDNVAAGEPETSLVAVSVQAQPVKTLVTVAAPAAGVEVSATPSGKTAPAVSSSGSFYTPPEPRSYMPRDYQNPAQNTGASSPAALASSGQTSPANPSHYANVPQPQMYDYAGAPNAKPAYGSSTASSTGTITTPAPSQATQVSSTSSTPASAGSTPVQQVARRIVTNGNASETVSVTSPSGNASAFITASQFSSNPESTNGYIDVSVGVTP